MDILASEESLERFLAGFRAGTLPKEVFSHSGHLTVAACYCLTYEAADCLEYVRRDIRHFNECVGGKNTEDSGYHETLTRLWLDEVRKFVDTECAGMSRLAAARRTVSRYGSRRDLFNCRYSFDLTASRQARLGWVAPDLPEPDLLVAGRE